jgi:hypothetical protein
MVYDGQMKLNTLDKTGVIGFVIQGFQPSGRTNPWPRRI